ncbi:PAS domain S-box protein [Pontiella sp.]|uniref:PAS domain S-box protein n=1 Tax=Pontiella sp. TaxID=2837462 RepID=UPI0035666DEC
MKLQERPELKLFGLPYEVSVALVYLVFASLWIFLTDLAERNLLQELGWAEVWHTYKGFLFVSATAVILWVALRRVFLQYRMVQDRLKASEERYRMLVERQSDLVVKVDPQGRFLYVSPSYCEMFGKTEAALLGNAFMPLVHEEDIESTEAAMTALYQPPYQAFMEQRALTKHGWRWFAWQDTAILDDNGVVKEIIGVGRDITQRKEAEEAYRASSERLELATTVAQIGIWEYEPATGRLIWDAQMFRIFDVDPAEFNGDVASWANAVHPDDLERVKAAFFACIEKRGNFEVEYRVVSRDGSIRHLRGLASITYAEDGSPARLVGTNWDVTEYKRAFDALKESERRFSVLVANLPGMAYRCKNDSHWTMEFISDGCCGITGYEPAELCGNATVSYRDLIHPDDRDEVERRVGEAVAEHREFELEYRLLAKDGAVKWMLERGAGVFDAGEGVLALEGFVWDETERKRLEEESHQVQRRLQHIVENTNDMVFQIDLEGNFTYVNRAATQVSGYSSDELLSMNMMQLVLPDFQPMIEERLRRRIEGRPRRRIEGRPLDGHFAFQIRHKQGHCVWVELATGPSYDTQGKLEGVQAIARDISSRKHAEAELEEQRLFLQSIINTIPDRVFWKDLESVYLGCNTSFAEDAGLGDPDELVGKTDYDMSWGRAEAALFRADDQAVVKSGTPRLNFEERQTRPDGTTSWLSTSKVPIRNQQGEIIGVLGAYQDIAERKRMEAERVRLVAAINQAAEAIVIMDVHGTLQYVNPAFEQMTGYSRKEAVGQNLSIIRSDGHDDGFYAGVWRTLESGGTWHGRFVNQRKGGDYYTTESVISPVRDSAGKIVDYVVSIRDISQQVELESHLRQAQKMEAVGRLAGGVAHDFNNILQSILGFSGILLAELEEGTSQHADADEIRKAARRAGDLTRQLLTLSRKHHVEYAVLDLNEIVRNSERMMERLIGEHIRLVFNLDAELKPVRVDRGQIEQILLNLFINARDAMPSGGTLTIDTRNVSAAEAIAGDRTARDHVCLCVADTGCGIREDVRQHLFEPFFTTKKVGEGTGLGLPVVYAIVQQHDGRIDVASTVGEGAEFKIYLPAHDRCSLAEGAPEKSLVPEVSPMGHGECVLVVEDDPSVRELSSRLLTNAGYCVVAVADCGQAMQALAVDEGVDLLLADVVLPDGNGVELARRIREQVGPVPVLLISGYVQDANVHDAINANGFRYLEKPVASMQLLQTVREMLDESDRL